MKMVSQLRAIALLAAMLAFAPMAAGATTILFSYKGNTTLNGSDTTAIGTGKFSFSPTSGPVTLADLTSFDFSWTAMLSGGGGSHFSIGLADLSAFSLSSGDSSSAAISLQSNFVNGTFVFAPENFGLSGTLLASTGLSEADNTITGVLGFANGPTTFIAAVPEPATWIMLLVGLSMIGALSRVAHRRVPSTLQSL